MTHSHKTQDKSLIKKNEIYMSCCRPISSVNQAQRYLFDLEDCIHNDIFLLLSVHLLDHAVLRIISGLNDAF